MTFRGSSLSYDEQRIKNLPCPKQGSAIAENRDAGGHKVGREKQGQEAKGSILTVKSSPTKCRIKIGFVWYSEEMCVRNRQSQAIPTDAMTPQALRDTDAMGGRSGVVGSNVPRGNDD